MGLIKYTMGKILRNQEEEQERKVAAKNFTDADREALRKENEVGCGGECCRDLHIQDD